MPEHLIIDPGSDFSQWLWRENVDEVVVGVDERRGGLPMNDLLACRQMGIEITDLISEESRLLEDVATLVAATGARPESDLDAALRSAMPDLPVHVVGDAQVPGNIEAAIASGHHAGRAV